MDPWVLRKSNAFIKHKKITYKRKMGKRKPTFLKFTDLPLVIREDILKYAPLDCWVLYTRLLGIPAKPSTNCTYWTHGRQSTEECKVYKRLWELFEKTRTHPTHPLKKLICGKYRGSIQNVVPFGQLAQTRIVHKNCGTHMFSITLVEHVENEEYTPLFVKFIISPCLYYVRNIPDLEGFISCKRETYFRLVNSTDDELGIGHHRIRFRDLFSTAERRVNLVPFPKPAPPPGQRYIRRHGYIRSSRHYVIDQRYKAEETPFISNSEWPGVPVVPVPIAVKDQDLQDYPVGVRVATFALYNGLMREGIQMLKYDANEQIDALEPHHLLQGEHPFPV